MSEEKMMRLKQAASKLNVGTTTLIEKLEAGGLHVDNNPNTKLSADHLQYLAKVFSEPSLLGGDDRVASTKTSSESKPVESVSTPAPKEVSEPEYIRMGHALGGPRIIGKIDLDKPAKPAPAPVQEVAPAPAPAPAPTPEPAPVPAPVPVAKVVEPVVAPPTPEPVVVKPTPPVPAPPPIPVVVEKVEEKKPIPPVVEVPKPVEKITPPVPKPEAKREPIKSAPIKPEPKPEPKPVVEVAPKIEAPAPTLVDVPNPDAVIVAKGEKLQGLKVLGKIELPLDRKAQQSADNKNKKKRKRVLKKGEKVGDTSSSPSSGGGGSGGSSQRPSGNYPPRPSGPGGNTNSSGGGNAGPRSTGNSAPRPTGGNSAPRPTGTSAPRPAGTTAPRAAGSTAPSTTTGGGARPGKASDKKKDKNRKDSVRDSDVKDSIKQTMARMNTKGPDFGSKYRRDKRRSRAEMEDAANQRELEGNQILRVTEFISASELASIMDVSVNEVISTCMSMGMFVSINQRLDAEAIQLISLEFGFDVEFISAEDELKSDLLETTDKPEDLLHRAPIVTIMGHVDHGKTSLLDYIRRTRVADKEAGGITQHIGAYSVKIKEGPNKGKQVTFLDTPGHEAFTAMRARGAKLTDIVIIVIAADDSVMPQTREAINHAQNAGVPIVFALNKIDKAGANPQKIREDLAKENILVESWGGKYQEQEVSAKGGIGIDELLDKVLLEAELLELKANPNREGLGTVVEASLDKGRGYVSTILVQNGTLNQGDIILAGQYFGRVRAMVNDIGERIQTAGPSIPVQILGLPGAPQAGDKFNIMSTEREAREIANKREQIIREQSIRAKKHITLDEIGRRKAIGAFHELNVIIKGDFDGSVEALSDSLLKLATAEVQVRIIHKAVGPISESDVLLATAADAIILGFQVRPSNNARKIADQEQIEIRLYSIIYDAIEEIKLAMEGLLAPKQEEAILGNIEIREVFKISKVGTVAGCYVLNGQVKRNNKIRIIREGIVVHEGEINQLKRFKDDVAEVKTGYECGLSIKNYHDLHIGDILESYEIREIKRTL